MKTLLAELKFTKKSIFFVFIIATISMGAIAISVGFRDEYHIKLTCSLIGIIFFGFIIYTIMVVSLYYSLPKNRKRTEVGVLFAIDTCGNQEEFIAIQNKFFEHFKSISKTLQICKYLIVEKKNNEYGLNEFAEKYIIFRFLPDKESYLKLSTEIASSTGQIKRELRGLQDQIETNGGLRNIISDWGIITEGDRIAAAKVYKLYGQTRIDCSKGKFFVESAYEEVTKTFAEIERSTMHPYVKYQKARILRMLSDTGYFKEDLFSAIKNAYQECIWIIKTNILYSTIRKTKTYASILWLFGMQLQMLKENRLDISRYFEESYEVFNDLGIRDEEFYQCVSYMGRNYLEIYKETRIVAYLRQARQMSELLYNERHKYNATVRNFATGLRNELKQYIPNLG